MVNIKFYRNNLQKTFEEIAEDFANSYPRQTRKNLIISKKFHDFLQSEEARSASEKIIENLITKKVEENLGGDVSCPMIASIKAIKDTFWQNAYWLQITACNGEDFEDVYIEILRKKNHGN